jgi:hypothetical protein
MIQITSPVDPMPTEAIRRDETHLRIGLVLPLLGQVIEHGVVHEWRCHSYLVDLAFLFIVAVTTARALQARNESRTALSVEATPSFVSKLIFEVRNGSCLDRDTFGQRNLTVRTVHATPSLPS